MISGVKAKSDRRRKRNRKRLTDRRDRFCHEYCIDYNATRAAIRAGYSVKTARSIGQRLLTKVDIASKIDALKNNLAVATGITAMKIAKEHEKLAFSSIAHLHNTWIERKEFDKLTDDQKACIGEISTKIRKIIGDDELGINVEYVKIKLYDKQKSLDSLSNMMGYNAPTKREITGKDGKDLIPILDLSGLTIEELKEYHRLIEKASGK